MTMTDTETPTTIEGLVARYPVGSRWRINTNNPCHTGLRVGDTVERVTYSTYPDGMCYSTFGEWRMWVQKIDENDRPDNCSVYVLPEHLDSLSTVEQVNARLAVDVLSREEHDAIVADIRRDLAARDARVAVLERQVATMQNDVVILNEVFSASASSNDLCAVYDETVDNFNARASIIQIEARTVTFNGTRRVPVTTYVIQSGTYEGRPSDEPSESDFDWSDIETHEVVEAVRNDFDADTYASDDFEYEESDS